MIDYFSLFKRHVDKLKGFGNQKTGLCPFHDNKRTPAFSVNVDNGSCVTELVYGCIYSSYIEYNADTNVPDNTLCEVLKEFGCTNEIAINYNPNANVDDGSCIIQGCTNILSFNYDAQANLDDGSCTPFIYGCTLEFFANFNPNANIDNGTCSDSQDLKYPS